MIIIALYLNVDNLPPSKRVELLEYVSKEVNKNEDKSVVYHIIPTHLGETRMELIYPPNLDLDILNEFMDKINIKEKKDI